MFGCLLQAGFEVAQIDTCLLCGSDDFGDACTVLHLMIAPEQGAAGAGAAVGENGLGNAFEQVLEGGDIGGVDGGRDDGLMMVFADACGFKPAFDLFERNLVFFFAVGTVADDGLDAEFGGFLNVGFGQLRGDIEVVGKFLDRHGFSFSRFDDGF